MYSLQYVILDKASWRSGNHLFAYSGEKKFEHVYANSGDEK